jgi:hypothetical protein
MQPSSATLVAGAHASFATPETAFHAILLWYADILVTSQAPAK